MTPFWRGALVVFVFAIVGPMIGASAFMAASLSYAIANGSGDPVGIAGPLELLGVVFGGLIVFMVAMLFGLWLGFKSAFVTGLFAVLISGYLKPDWLWVSVVTLLGAATTFALGRTSIFPAGGDDPPGKLMLAGIGALAALVCSVWTRRLRRSQDGAAAPLHSARPPSATS